MDMKKLESMLHDANGVMAQVSPLIGVIGGLAALAIQTAHRVGVDTTAFEAEIASFHTAREALGASIEEFRAKYPTVPTT